MRSLVYLLFLFCSIAFGQISGAVGNGTTDDTAAVQTWLDSGGTGPVGTETYRITAKLDIDQSGNQTVDFNGATITVTADLPLALEIDKPSGTTTLNNLTIDGNTNIREGIEINSLTSTNNLTINDLYFNGGNAVGIRLEIFNDATQFGAYVFTNTNMSNIKSQGNGVVGDAIGAARMVLQRWHHNSSGTTITFDGGTFDGCWGDDGDMFQFEDVQQGGTLNSLITIKNMTLGYFSRRHIKSTSGWMHVINNNFTVPPAGHPELVGVTTCCSTTAANLGDGPTAGAENHKYIGNTLNGTGGNPQARRMVVTNTVDLEIRDNTLIDYDIDLQGTNSTSGIVVCGNDWDNNSVLKTSVVPTEDVQVGTNNTGNPSFNQIPVGQYVTKTDCPAGSGATPIITLNGSTPVNITQGGTYTELGASWTDAEDGSGSATVGGDTVDTNVIGTYTVTYNHTDIDGNAATQVTRTVNIVAAPSGIKRASVPGMRVNGKIYVGN